MINNRGLVFDPQQDSGDPSQAMRCGVNWRPDRQSFYCGATRYVHNGPTNTSPSHDIAHVLVGASSTLPWLPLGSDVTIRIAEFNAVMCETLLDKVFRSIYTESLSMDCVIDATISHALWFMEHHYAPFPLPPQTAIARFAQGIQIDSLARLAPLFIRQKWRELANGDTDRSCRICFLSNQTPRATREISVCQNALCEQLSTLANISAALPRARRDTEQHLPAGNMSSAPRENCE